jgi:predicted extracellular nuclease
VHVPSRREGALASEPNREAAAKTVRKVVNEIQMVDSQAAIIIMGDFNDNPSDKVPTTTLSALPYTSGSFEDLKLYNLCWDGYPFENREIGSYFHDGEWDMLDQIIVSGALLNGNLSVRVMPEAEVYHPKWISKRDKRTGEMIPKRTYVGPFYQGGVSDHFPVFMEIFFKNEL